MRHPFGTCWLRNVAVVASLLPAVSIVAADEPAVLAEALPKDGAWARYHVMAKTVFEGGQTSEDTMTFTFAFVGRATHEGKECRWIEATFKHEMDQTDCVKLLVSEKDLRESERPFDHVLKCRRKGPDGNIVDVADETPRALGIYAVFLPGRLKIDHRLNEPRTVKYQQGNLEIATGWRGRYVLTDGTSTTTSDYSIWMHPNVPVGFAYATMKLASKSDDEEELGGGFEFFLEDTGTDAKPSF